MSFDMTAERSFSWEYTPIPAIADNVFNQETSGCTTPTPSGCATPETSSLRITRQPVARTLERQYRLASDEEVKRSTQKCCRKFGNVITFIVLLCIITFTNAAIDIIVIPNNNIIRFLDDAGFVVSVLIWAYIGSTTNRPRVIAVGTFLTALGFAFVSIPSVLFDYEHTQTNASHHPSIVLCTNNSNGTNYDLNNEDSYVHTMHLPKMILIVIGSILYGIGKAPLFPLSIASVDDFTKEAHKTSVYIGILATFACISRVVCHYIIEILGALDTSYQNEKERGKSIHELDDDVWWPGYVIGCGVLLTCAALLLSFPNRLQNISCTCCRPKKRRSGSCNSDDVFGTIRSSRKISTFSKAATSRFKRVRDLFKTSKQLITNPVLIPVLLSASCDTALVICMLSYIDHYCANQLSVSKSSSSVILAGIIILAVIIGNIINCLYITLLKPTSKHLTLVLMMLCILAVLATLPIIFLTDCDNPKISGIQLEASQCGCSCPSNTYSPVCGSDDVTYVTPCHAGCQGVACNRNNNNTMFFGCSCVSTEDFNQTDQHTVAVDGECDSDCDIFLPFTIFIASIICIESSKINPTIMIALRVVKQEDRTFVLGFGAFLIILLGFFPTVYYLQIIENATCMLDISTSYVEKPCAIYDKRLYRFVYYGITIAFNMIGVALLCFAYRKAPNNDQPNWKDSLWYSLRSRGDSMLRRNNVVDEFEYYSPPQTVTTFTSTSSADRLQLDIIRPN